MNLKFNILLLLIIICCYEISILCKVCADVDSLETVITAESPTFSDIYESAEFSNVRDFIQNRNGPLIIFVPDDNGVEDFLTENDFDTETPVSAAGAIAERFSMHVSEQEFSFEDELESRASIETLFTYGNDDSENANRFRLFVTQETVEETDEFLIQYRFPETRAKVIKTVECEEGLAVIIDKIMDAPKNFEEIGIGINWDVSRMSDFLATLDKDTPFTFFLPNTTLVVDDLESMIQKHTFVSSDQSLLFSDDLDDLVGQDLEAYNGNKFRLTKSGGVYFLGGVEVVPSDILFESGIAHYVEGFLPEPTSSPTISPVGNSTAKRYDATFLNIFGIVASMTLLSIFV